MKWPISKAKKYNTGTIVTIATFSFWFVDVILQWWWKSKVYNKPDTLLINPHPKGISATHYLDFVFKRHVSISNAFTTFHSYMVECCRNAPFLQLWGHFSSAWRAQYIIPHKPSKSLLTICATWSLTFSSFLGITEKQRFFLRHGSLTSSGFSIWSAVLIIDKVCFVAVPVRATNGNPYFLKTANCWFS